MAIISESKDEFNDLLLLAVRTGDTHSLETCLYSVIDPKSYVNRIYNETEEQKCTLIMKACLNGYTDMIHMLLTLFQPNIELLNDIKISVSDQNLKLYEDVTVLWAAAAMNNFEIVKILVEYGAQVNHRTKTNSTAIRCACFHGNMIMVCYLIDNGADIRIAKVHNDTNLILSVFRQHVELVKYLIDELGCDINECDDEGRSSLYLAVERGSIELIEFLLNRGARNIIAIHDQISPLMLAAEKRRIDLVNIILPYCSLFERIQAEELLASAFACIEYGTCDLEKTFEHLSKALELRSIHQISKTLKESTDKVFNHRQECQTIEQLKELRTNSDDMYIEALLIRERILGSSNLKYRNSLLHRGATLINTTQYLQGITVWLYELELHQKWSIPISSKQLRHFVRTFALLIYRSVSIPISNLCKLILAIMDALKNNINEFDYNLYTLLFLITITSQIITKTIISDTDRRIFYQLIYSINQQRYITHEDGSSLLHLCLNEQTSALNISIDRICKYPCKQTIRILLQCGANVNATNIVRNTPLHIFASNSNDCDESILQLLCDANVHFDYGNDLKQTPLDMAFNLNTRQLLKTKFKQNLKCLCARIIQRHNISYHGKIVKSLINFVEQH